MSAVQAAPAIATRPLPGSIRLFWRSFSENRGAVLGLGLMIVLVLLAVFADVVAPHSPIEQFRDHIAQETLANQIVFEPLPDIEAVETKVGDAGLRLYLRVVE